MKKLTLILGLFVVVLGLTVGPAQRAYAPPPTTTTTTTQPPPPVGNLMGGGAWDPANPPVLYVDETFNSPEALAILAGTCAYDAVLNSNPSGIVGILHGGLKDTRSVIGNGPYGLLDAGAVPSGEIWATWDGLGVNGPLATSIRSPQPGAWENYLIVFNSDRQADWGTASQYAPLSGCGADIKVGGNKYDLQSLSTHELGHAFADLNDLCSDATEYGTNGDCNQDDEFYPNAGCYYGQGNDTQIGYAMCSTLVKADNNDKASRRLLDQEEVNAVLEKYWDDTPPPTTTTSTTTTTLPPGVVFSDNFSNTSKWEFYPTGLGLATFTAVNNEGILRVENGYGPAEFGTARIRAIMPDITDADFYFTIRSARVITAGDFAAQLYIGIDGGGLWESVNIADCDVTSGEELYLQNSYNFYTSLFSVGNPTTAQRTAVMESQCSAYPAYTSMWTILPEDGSAPGFTFPLSTSNLRVRFQVEGTTIRMKWWNPSNPEPASWNQVGIDNDGSPSHPGVISVALRGSPAQIGYDNIYISDVVVDTVP